MNKKEAIQAMLDGKKARQSWFAVEAYIEFKDGSFKTHVDRPADFLALGNEDWEIYEEPKPTKTITIEKWLMKRGDKVWAWEADNDYFSSIPPDTQQVKLLDSYTVEIDDA